MSNNNENNINIYPKSWELYDGREYDKWNQSSHYRTLMLKWQRKHNRYHNEDDSEVYLK